MGGRGSSSKFRERKFTNLENSDRPEVYNFFGVGNGGAFDKWKNNLSKKEKDSIYSYSSGSDLINSILRNPDDDYSSIIESVLQAKEDIQNLTSALANTPLEKNIVVHRYDSGGFGGGDIDKLKVGEIIESRGFLSTSTRRIYDFGRVGYDISIPKGAKAGHYLDGLSAFSGESEFLIKNKAQFRVTGCTEDEYGHKVVELEYIK